MRQRSLSAAALALVLGCGSTPPPIAPEPVPSTDRDPRTWLPSADVAPVTGEPVAVAFSGGAEQARSLLVSLVLAIRDGDRAAIEAALAERVGHGERLPGAPSTLARTTWTRTLLARQILAGAAGSHVQADASFESLIDPATIGVVDVATRFEGAPPEGVRATDTVLFFTPTAAGRRLLAGLGSTSLVIRPGPTPVVIAR